MPVPRGSSVEVKRWLDPLSNIVEHPGYGRARNRWLRRQVAQPHLRFHKVARKVLIDLEGLDRLVEQAVVETYKQALFWCQAQRHDTRTRCQTILTLDEKAWYVSMRRDVANDER